MIVLPVAQRALARFARADVRQGSALALLRVTRAALSDLGVDPSHAGRPAEELIAYHPVIKAFVERRSQSPEGQETTTLPVTRAVVYNLHSGTARGLTWHEEADDLDVVWLLGVAWHKGDSFSDAYRELKARDDRGALFPDDDDYADLEPNPVEFVELAAREMPELVARAHLVPEEIHGALIAGVLDVVVMVRPCSVGDTVLTETWIGVRLPPAPGVVMPSDFVAFVLAAAFPDHEVDDLRFESQGIPGQPVDSAQLVYSYVPFTN
jgi:hypothetical protein